MGILVRLSACLLFIASACSDEPASSLDEAAPQIREIEIVTWSVAGELKPIVMVHADLGEITSINGTWFEIGRVVRGFGRALAAGAPLPDEEPERIIFDFRHDVADRLGNERTMRMVALTFERADLVNANYDNLDDLGTVNLLINIEFNDRLFREGTWQNCQTNDRIMFPTMCRLLEAGLRF